MASINTNILRLTPALACAAILSACAPVPDKDSEPSLVTIAADGLYPDYRDVTIPRNIAPLNFMLTDDDVDAVCADFSAGGETLRVASRGRKVVIGERDWHKLLSDANVDRISVNLYYRRAGFFLRDTFSIEVSNDALDPYVTYRLIEPGYEVWNHIQIEERDMTTFDTRILADNKNIGGRCMNCHIHSEDGNSTLFHVRGNGGASLFAQGDADGSVRKGIRRVTLRDPRMKGGAVYGELSADGHYGVFSSNEIIPLLHSEGSRRLEVYDAWSDLCIYDFRRDTMILSSLVSGDSDMETFPCFSPDARTVYYCSAPALPLPDSIDSLRYSILRLGFDGNAWTGPADTIWSAPRHRASASFPKVSPDGRFLLFCASRCGTFPIWHRETCLRMIDLRSGKEINVNNLNSPVSDTYHSWSSSSRWVVFASKRTDGQYGRIYIAHIDEDGQASRPFALPQEDPEHDILSLKSFNIPDISPRPAPFSESDVIRQFPTE